MAEQKINIPERDIAALDHIAERVIGLRIGIVNVYAITGRERGWILVDAGLPHTAAMIRNWVATHFGEKSTPEAILLTHGHFDHAGAAKDLAEQWNVPVYAHRLELPYITAEKSYPAPEPAAGGLMALLSPLYPRQVASVGQYANELQRDGAVPVLEEWRWIHTPGHTDGHVSFYREDDRTLLAGDAFCTTKAESLIAVATQKPEMHGPPAYYTSNWDLAKRSVEALAQIEPRVVAPGHGRPIVGANVPAELRKLAANFDAVARPRRAHSASGT